MIPLLHSLPFQNPLNLFYHYLKNDVLNNMDTIFLTNTKQQQIIQMSSTRVLPKDEKVYNDCPYQYSSDEVVDRKFL